MTEFTKTKKKHYGHYGLINISDSFLKKCEFIEWLKDEHDKTIDQIRENERKYWEEFIHNFNNCKFKDKKYYNIFRCKKKKLIHELKRKHNEDNDNQVNLSEDSDNIIKDNFYFDDEAQKNKEKKILKGLEQTKKLEEALTSMSKEKAEQMKEVDFRSHLMRHYYQTGNITAAKDIHNEFYGKKKENKPKETTKQEDYEDDLDL